MGPVSELAPLPERLVVRRWVDPVVERFGFPVNSTYTETGSATNLGPFGVLVPPQA